MLMKIARFTQEYLINNLRKCKLLFGVVRGKNVKNHIST